MKHLSSASLVLSAALLAACATGGPLGKADKRFMRGEYQTAIQLYQAVLKGTKEVGQANFKIAESYRLSNRLKDAQPYYEAALGKGIKTEEAFFYHALALKAVGRGDDATTAFQEYIDKGGRKFADRAQQEVTGLKMAKTMMAKPPRYEVRGLDQVNTDKSEYSAALRNGELYFASGRDAKTFPGNGEPFTDLFTLKFDDAATMLGGAPAKIENQAINMPEQNEGSPTFSPDGTVMIFARGNDGSKKGALSVDLYQARFENGGWGTPTLMTISVPNADDFSPALAPDGQTLYFASARRGGAGGNDIYRATSAGNGKWNAPEAVSEVNTAGNENFPGVAADGTLYFSSDTHPGFGGLDIFALKKGQVTNEGMEINSPGDDFAPLFTGPGMGIVSSNRAGGKGSDDLYMFKRLPRKTVTFYADGTLMSRPEKGTDLTPRPVPNSKVTMVVGIRPVGETMTDGAGKFSFKVDSAQTYRFVAEKDNFFTASQGLTVPVPLPQEQLPQPQNDVKLPLTLTLVEIVKDKPIVLENILYDYNKSNIRPDAALELDKLVTILQENPKISVELSSHTDSRGKDPYNMKLSADRAKSAVAYIISKGIDKSRMTSRGYGETRPIVKNATTEEEFQTNRRTEFKVTKIAE
ncbi:MAG: OmpA family protein [Hymenobacteraceae bacterium]|nr:OmpA family protein [Hymenobacteraceae bacterium]